MANPTDALLAFCQAAGISSDAAREAESSTFYHLAEDVSVRDLKHLSVDDLERVRDTFGSALTLTIGVAGLPLLELRQGAFETSPQTMMRELDRRSDDLTLHVDLQLEKSVFLIERGIAGDDFYSLLFFFQDRLVSFLDAPLRDVDEPLFKDRTTPTRIVVGDADVYYASRLLTIVGWDRLANAQMVPAPLDAKTKGRIDRYYETAHSELNWVGFELTRVTPLHFLCRTQKETAALGELLATHALHTCIVFTANRSIRNAADEDIRAVYTGKERTATLALSDDETRVKGRQLARLALWPYGGNGDRLTIFQSVVARELETDAPAENYRVFQRRLAHILEEARWHYRVFVDSQIDAHFEQVQAVTTYVAEAAHDVSQTIDTVTKGLTDTLLATVGVIVLTLLAALVSGDTQEIIFRYSMFGYVVYLILFQLLYRLGSIWHSYTLLTTETHERLETYARMLGTRKVDAIATPLARRENQFRTWFGISAVIYVAVAVFIVWLGATLPEYLLTTGAMTPSSPPTSTPTVTPVP